MKRLNTLLINNNYISKISPLGDNLPNLATLILTNNKISILSEIDNIASFTHLEMLSLLDNPVALRENYRLYVIHKIPSLKSLDFRKVKKQERLAASQLFASTEGQALMNSLESEVREQQEAARKGMVLCLIYKLFIFYVLHYNIEHIITWMIGLKLLYMQPYIHTCR